MNEERVAKFDQGTMILFCLMSLLCPLAGWIVGGVNRKHLARQEQAGLLIGLATISFIVGVVSML